MSTELQPPPPSLVLVVTTVATQADARHLAHALVERRLAACVQIEPIESVYRWQGAVQSEAEWRLSGKTLAARCEAAMAALREAHPYELPAIHAVAVERASDEEARWVAEATGP